MHQRGELRQRRRLRLSLTKANDSSSIGGYSTTPPTEGLNLFHLYVALSQSSGLGRSTIQLLRDFDGKLFQAAHEPEPLAEDDWLEELNGKTLA